MLLPDNYDLVNSPCGVPSGHSEKDVAAIIAVPNLPCFMKFCQLNV